MPNFQFKKTQVVHITYEIKLLSREKLTLPPSLVESIGAGNGIITIEAKLTVSSIVRRQNAFLQVYASEEEGFYDEYSSE